MSVEPDLTDNVREAVIRKLRAQTAKLRARGVDHLWLFGSLARREAGRDSDIDLLADFAPEAKVSLVTLASLRAELSELLGARADLVSRSSLRGAVRQTAERDAIAIL